MGKKYDVFISYRRIGGEATARIIKERLTDMGYNVFFDVESLRSGDFNTKLYDVIEQCTDFLIILSPEALNRCENEKDWVRLELKHALEHNKNIVPVLLRGFTFPDILPADIEGVRYKSGLEANSEFFDAFIERLGKFLHTKSKLVNRIVNNSFFKKMLPALIAFALVAAASFGGLAIYNNTKVMPFPLATVEKNTVNEMFIYLRDNLLQADIMISNTGTAYNQCLVYLANEANIHETEAVINRAINKISDIDLEKYKIPDRLSANLDNTPIDKANILLYDSTLSHFKNDCINGLRYMSLLIRDDFLLDIPTKKKIVEIYKQMLDLSAQFIIYSANSVIIPIDEDYLKSFKTSLTPLTTLPIDGYVWQKSESDLENQAATNVYKLEGLTNDFAAIVGNMNTEYANELSDILALLEESDWTTEEIDSYISQIIKSANNAAEIQQKNQMLREELQKLRDSLEKQYDEARVKFAPLETDDIWTIWGKMRRFITLGLYDEAISCAQAFQQKARGEEQYSDIYIPAVINYIKNIKNTGIDYGIIVVDFEPDKTEHEIYKIGDIIIAVNNKIIYDFDDFANMKRVPGNTVTLLRQNESGGVDFVDVHTVENQSGIFSMEIGEKNE